jgi:hypothetical protein
MLPNEETLKEVFKNVKFTFSKNCISGLVTDCDCKRCRQNRGQEVTAETEAAAEERSKTETAAFHEQQRQQIKKLLG